MDFFGGTKGTALSEEYERHRLGLTDDSSSAIRAHQSTRRVNKLKSVVEEVKELNEHITKHH